MEAAKTLSLYKKKVDPEIEKYFARVIKEAKKEDRVVAQALDYVKKIILSGGKRLRPAFMYFGYLAGGGKNREKMINASVSIELIHMFLLIHDDIIDRDDLRHGIDTVNLKYKKIAARYFPEKDTAHFGNSMGIIIGDMVGAMGNQIIYESTFDPKLIVRALYKLQSIVSMTVVGEAKDVWIEYSKKAAEADVMKMYEYKTAKYTIEGPLHLGAILAGADEELLEALSNYAIPIGIAFQIQDDILGVFGNESKMGKPVGSDIVGGKQTLLVVKAYEKGSRSQKKILDKYLGNKNLKFHEIEEFRKVIIDTGSLDYARKMATDLIYQGKIAAEEMKINREAKEFLAGIADYMVKREL
jgi:geranylgeranyl diphosphate synthase, type I